MLTITVDDSAIRATMSRLQEGMSDLTPVMEKIGYTLETNTRNRFETRTDPNGQAWKPWQPNTLKHYFARAKLAKGDNNTLKHYFARTKYARGDEGPGNGKLLDRSGTMLNGLSYKADAKSVRVGFAMPYAVYHEYGTKKMHRRGMLMGNPDAGTLGKQDEQAVIDILNKHLNDLAP